MSEAPATPAKPNLPEYSVSEIAFALKRTVEDAFPFVRVRGEVSNLKFHSSGHVYFDLKDDKAALNAVIWRMTAQRLKVKPEAGIEIVCTGRVSTYPGSSRYQLVVDHVELAGLGALMAMLDQRKKKLAAEGLFDSKRKRRLPFLPEVIGVVTSPTGAVIRDIMHRLTARFPRRVLLWPVAVQGEYAASEIARAVAGFNKFGFGHPLPKPDVLIVARGGGSIEDLMAFNEEIVVRAVAASSIPVISAVGHETDTTLIDLAADIRAPTPTAAAELAVPVRTDLIARALDLDRRMLRSFSRGLDDRGRHLAQIARVLPRADQLFAGPRQRLDQAGEKLSHGLRQNLHVHRGNFIKAAAQLRPSGVQSRIRLGRERTKTLSRRLDRAHKARLGEARTHVDALGRMLESLSYVGVLERGYAVVQGEDGKVRRAAASVVSGEKLTLSFADGQKGATADGAAVRAKAKPRAAPQPANGRQGKLF
jgi:exodeoxyribonuclease VII large subunit